MRATIDHFEIPVVDSERLAGFLGLVFGWVCEDPAEESTQGSKDQARSAPLGTHYRSLAPAGAAPESVPPAVRVGLFEGSRELLDRGVPVVRLEGETLEFCLGRVASAGGQVVLEPKAIGDWGRFARFEDPEGNQWGVWEPVPPSVRRA